MTEEYCGCDEFQELERGLSRRTFINAALALGGGLLLTDATGFQYSTAAYGATESDVIIAINMRGGMDGIMAVQPLGDPMLKRWRPNLSLADSQTIALNQYFGLHPNLTNFKTLFDTGDLAVVHAVGTPVGTRSHFDDQKSLELAAYNNPAETQGWQNRLLQAKGTNDVFAGFSPQYQTPISLMGSQTTAVFNNVNNVILDNFKDLSRVDYLNILRKMHTKSSHSWQKIGISSIAASEKLRSLKSMSSITYPSGVFALRMKTLAQLIKSGVKVNTASIDFDGQLDVHSAAGVAAGTMADNFKDLDSTIAAFKQDIGDLWGKVTIVTLTEFGRRLQENASQGVDHGWASAMFLMGGGIRGGQVLANWPGLSTDNLRDGDLQVTLDYRHVLSEILRNRGGFSASQASNVLPGFVPKNLGLTKSL